MENILVSKSIAARSESISHRFRETLALENVSVTIERGSFHGIIGPNGAGKTTLIELMIGTQRVQSGIVEVLDQAPLPRDVKLLRRIGIQPQQAAFFSRATAWEHLSTIASLYDVPESKARTVFSQFGLDGLEKVRAARLSGGQQQRLGIASALVHEPELVFLDEPTASLDIRARHELLDVLAQLKETGTTVVCSTHHLSDAERLCDVVTIVDRGKIVTTERPLELIRRGNYRSKILLPMGHEAYDVVLTLPEVASATITQDGVLAQVYRVGVAIAEFEQAGVSTEGLRVSEPGLEEVYLELTGREYAN